jgi:phage/plasmid-like protein (TIGR03299 family)
MADNITIRVDGRPEMAYSDDGEVPWHGFARRVRSDLTPDQMMEEAGVGWEVGKVKAHAKIGGKSIDVDRSVLYRKDNQEILSVVSNNWEDCSNKQAFEFFTDFVVKGDATMHTAGSLQGGKIVWALAKVADSFELFDGDRIDSFLLFSNPHLFGMAIDVRFTPILVVCNNTLNLSLSRKGDNMVKWTHRRKFNADQVKTVLGIAHEKMVQYKEMAEYLGSKRYTAENIAQYFKDVFPVITEKKDSKREMSKSAKSALDAMDTQPGREYATGTWWQAANAVTYVLDHKVGRGADTRMMSSWFGPGRTQKLNALEKAMEYAKAA